MYQLVKFKSELKMLILGEVKTRLNVLGLWIRESNILEKIIFLITLICFKVIIILNYYRLLLFFKFFYLDPKLSDLTKNRFLIDRTFV